MTFYPSQPLDLFTPSTSVHNMGAHPGFQN